MGSPTEEELKLLFKYVEGKKFIIETGRGKSTKILSRVSKCEKIISIESGVVVVDTPNVEMWNGWSVSFDDIIKKGDKDFVDSRYKNTVDRKIALGNSSIMTGDVDLIRKALDKYSDLGLDFFFCDTGEFCGLAEWRIVKDKIIKGGIFAAHDIYYPKSIKCFKVCEEIENSDCWEVIVKTNSKQGLLIAKKVR